MSPASELRTEIHPTVSLTGNQKKESNKNQDRVLKGAKAKRGHCSGYFQTRTGNSNAGDLQGIAQGTRQTKREKTAPRHPEKQIIKPMQSRWDEYAAIGLRPAVIIITGLRFST